MLYGTEAQLATNSHIVKEAFEKAGGEFVTGKDREGNPDAIHWENMMTGKPELSEFGMYNFRGGGGATWFAPAVPPRASDVIKSYNLTADTFRKYGFDYTGGFLIGISGRHTEHAVDLFYNRADPEEMQRAYACFKEALAVNAAAGYGVYRSNPAFFDQAAETHGPEQRAFNKRLKKTLDPNGIVAPGKSGIYV